jgi:hypothetical protein
MSPRESEHLKRDTAHHRWCECGMCTATDADVYLCVLCTVCVVWRDMMVVVVLLLARVSVSHDSVSRVMSRVNGRALATRGTCTSATLTRHTDVPSVVRRQNRSRTARPSSAHTNTTTPGTPPHNEQAKQAVTAALHPKATALAMVAGTYELHTATQAHQQQACDRANEGEHAHNAAQLTRCSPFAGPVEIVRNTNHQTRGTQSSHCGIQQRAATRRH